MWRIGVDLGGTKIEALALSEDHQEFERRRIPTPHGDYAGTIDAIAELVGFYTKTLGADAIAGVGIGIPGSLSPKTGLVRNANSVWLNGRPFGADLQARLDMPLVIQNDANCFALSEAIDGAAKGYDTVFGVILGTGVGGGIVIGGRAILGRNAIGGEWGHNPLPWPDINEMSGPSCYCGKAGCIETFLSGPAFEEQFQARAGTALSARDIAALAAKGSADAQDALGIYARRLAKALASVINIIDPDVVVFGGGMSNIASAIEQARMELDGWVFSDYCRTEFKVNKWGDSSGVRGAARLVPLS